MEIIVWPDYTWCEPDELSEYSDLSDDFMRIVLPDDVGYDDVDAWLMKHRPQG